LSKKFISCAIAATAVLHVLAAHAQAPEPPRDVVRELVEADKARAASGEKRDADPFKTGTYLRSQLFSMSLNGYPSDRIDLRRLTPQEQKVMGDTVVRTVRAQMVMDSLARRCGAAKEWQAALPAQHDGQAVRTEPLTRAEVIEDAKLMLPPAERAAAAAQIERQFADPALAQVPCERARYEDAFRGSLVTTDAYLFYRKAGIDRAEAADFEAATAKVAADKVAAAATHKHCPQFGTCTTGYDLVLQPAPGAGTAGTKVRKVDAVAFDSCTMTFRMGPLSRANAELVAEKLATMPADAVPSEFTLDWKKVAAVREWQANGGQRLFVLTGDFPGLRDVTLAMGYKSPALVGALEKLRTSCAG
jgi:hypothetical protein